MADITISAIVAMARNGAIGKNNQMLWHIPEDFRYFKKTTMGKPIIMGRRTHESLGKPLPGRPNIVVSLSIQPAVIPYPENGDGPYFSSSLEEAFSRAKTIAKMTNSGEIFIIGGGQIYAETLPMVDRLYLTLIDRDYEGDTYFPAFDWKDWTIVSEEKRENDPPFTFYVLERK